MAWHNFYVVIESSGTFMVVFMLLIKSLWLFLPITYPTHPSTSLGWGHCIFLLLFAKYLWDLLNHTHICQVSLQLSCSDTWQIWMWYSTGECCFVHSEKKSKMEITAGGNGLVTPTPDLWHMVVVDGLSTLIRWVTSMCLSNTRRQARKALWPY